MFIFFLTSYIIFYLLIVLFIIIKKKTKEFVGILFFFMLIPVILVINHSASTNSTVILNEVCSNNFSILTNSNQDYRDYIELYNSSDSDVSLHGWTLNTESDLSLVYTFKDVILPAHSYLLLLHNPNADNNSPTVVSDFCQSLEINCPVTKYGETVYLCNSAGKTADAVVLPAMSYDTVYARSADGDSQWAVYTPTPGSDNSAAVIFDSNRDAFFSDSPAYPIDYPDASNTVLSLRIYEYDMYGDDGIFLPENLSKSGRSSERMCRLDYFSDGKTCTFSQKSGIRISSGSRNLEHLNFNLYAREIYDTADTFSYDFFSLDTPLDKLTLRYQADKEYELNQFLQKCGFVTPAALPCSVFINGSFYGDYYLMEPMDEDYLARVNQLSPENITLIEDNELESGLEYSRLSYLSLLENAVTLDFTQQENYKFLAEQIDMDSLIDCYAIQLYLNNTEFSIYKNCTLWRSEPDGIWHYEITGLDDSLSTADTFNTCLQLYLKDPLFQALVFNEDFYQALDERIALFSQNYNLTYTLPDLELIVEHAKYF